VNPTGPHLKTELDKKWALACETIDMWCNYHMINTFDSGEGGRANIVAGGSEK